MVFAGSREEAGLFLKDYMRLGYRYEENAPTDIRAQAVRDTERLVVQIDSDYYYDEKGYLRFKNPDKNSPDFEKFQVRSLFHRLNQAKNSLAFVVLENEAVYAVLLELLQMHNNLPERN